MRHAEHGPGGHDHDGRPGRKRPRGVSGNESGGFAYFLGFLGAAVYYIGSADGFWHGVFGFGKAMVWPAFLVYEALRFVGA